MLRTVSLSFPLLIPTDNSIASTLRAAIPLERPVHPVRLDLVGYNPELFLAFGAFPPIPALQIIQPFPDIALTCIRNQLLENVHARLAANEQLHAARIADYVRLLFLGLPYVETLPAQGARKPSFRTQTQVEWHGRISPCVNGI